MGTFQKHLEAVQSGTVTKFNVIGIRKAYNAGSRAADGLSIGITAPDWSREQLTAIDEALHMFRPRVVGALHESGLKLLRDRRYKKRLAWQQTHIARIDHFRLCWFSPVGAYQCCPVYEACNADGSPLLRFRNVPWQTARDTGIESGPYIIRGW